MKITAISTIVGLDNGRVIVLNSGDSGEVSDDFGDSQILTGTAIHSKKKSEAAPVVAPVKAKHSKKKSEAAPVEAPVTDEPSMEKPEAPPVDAPVPTDEDKDQAPA